MQVHIYACFHTQMQIHLHRKNRTYYLQCKHSLIWDIIPDRIFWKGANSSKELRQYDDVQLRNYWQWAMEDFSHHVIPKESTPKIINTLSVKWGNSVIFLWTLVIKVTLDKPGSLRIIHFWSIVMLPWTRLILSDLGS